MNIFIIGGGAAGFFCALSAKQTHPDANVIIIEKTAKLLAKVKISGGGRCNVTHHCFDIKELIKRYPRGSKELIGPMHRFGPQDTIDWFEARGVAIKAEEDGRMFPITDSSQTIIDCLMKEAEVLGVKIWTLVKVKKIKPKDDLFELEFADGQVFTADHLVIATGSSIQGHRWVKELGHKVIDPVPSLFTFNIPNSPLSHLSGASVQEGSVQIEGTKLKQQGPVLITHFGLSGPAVLKLSAYAARELHQTGYQFNVFVNWLGSLSADEVITSLEKLRADGVKSTLLKLNPFKLPKKLWKTLLEIIKIDLNKVIVTISNKEIVKVSQILTNQKLTIKGKTTHKEEFVTAGGVDLKEVNFKTMQSKRYDNLSFAGEVLNIDGITGGFNFQNAWTTGAIAGESI